MCQSQMERVVQQIQMNLRKSSQRNAENLQKRNEKILSQTLYKCNIDAENAARNLGWIQIKQGRYYIRWETVNSYLSEMGISQQVGKNDFIPEAFFYLLGMKASNETAQEFQKWLAVEVLPEIRKTGGYRLNKELSPEIKAILCIDNHTVIMENRLESLENNMTIDYSQQEELRTLAVKRVVSTINF